MAMKFDRSTTLGEASVQELLSAALEAFRAQHLAAAEAGSEEEAVMERLHEELEALVEQVDRAL